MGMAAPGLGDRLGQVAPEVDAGGEKMGKDQNALGAGAHAAIDGLRKGGETMLQKSRLDPLETALAPDLRGQGEGGIVGLGKAGAVGEENQGDRCHGRQTVISSWVEPQICWC